MWARPRSKGALQRAAVLLAILVVAFFMGALLGMGQVFLVLLVLGPLLVALSITVFVATLGWRHDTIFWTLVFAAFTTTLAASLLKMRLTLLSSGLLLLALPFVVVSVMQMRRYSRHANAAIAIVVAFLVVSIVSSIAGPSGFMPALYTGLMNLKPFILAGLGAALIWSARTEKAFDFVIAWAWLPFLLLGALQWFAPSVYGVLMSDPDSMYSVNPFMGRFPRARGPFSHPEVMAMISGVFAVFNFVHALVARKGLFLRLAITGAYLVVVLMTGQRQELAATLVMLPVVFALARWRPSFTVLVAATFVSMVVVALALFAILPGNVEHELRDWGILSGFGERSPRAILYGDAVQLANRYWPLGSGMGTFASVGAVRMDPRLFLEMGYQSYWWYSGAAGNFLFDSFWSHYIAEAGWIGFGLHLLFYVVILHAVVGWLRDPLVQRSPKLFSNALMALAGLLLVLLVSPTSNALAELNGSMFPLIYIGVAWRQIVLARKHALSAAAEPAAAAPRGTHWRPVNAQA